jgi:hypothetical protein
MARARTIKPGFFKNEILGECQPLARLLFAGLWTLADKDGRLEDRPRRIKAEILPYDDADVDNLLGELHERYFIQRYEVDGQKLIQITKFAEHQRPHPNEQGWGFPPCPVGLGKINEDSGNEITLPEDSGKEIALPEDSGNSVSKCALSSSSLSSSSLSSSSLSPLDAAEPAEGVVRDFERFWEAYPRQDAREDALTAWERLAPTPELVETILGAVEGQKSREDWQRENGRFIPRADNWLNGKRWQDKGTAAQAIDAGRRAALRDWIARNRLDGETEGEVQCSEPLHSPGEPARRNGLLEVEDEVQ